MRNWIATGFAALAIACIAAPPALAQQKTAKQCRQEWQANKQANQSAGLTEKDYVAKCRSGASAPAAAQAPTKATPGSSGGAQTVKACRDEWRANREANQAAGVTEKDYVAKCRSGQTAGRAPTAPRAQAPAAAPRAEVPAMQPSRRAAAQTGAHQYASEGQAKSRCPSDTVVWANLDSKIYHFSGTKDYGTTKDGAYMCEKDAKSESFRAAQNEKHP